MQDLPEKRTLLAGVARFLAKDLLPHVSDRGAAFRVRIAAHLLQVVSRELAMEGYHDPKHLAALQGLLAQDADLPEDPEAREAEIARLNQALAQAIRAGEVDETAARQAMLAVLADKLAVSNPRFDLTQELP